MKAMKQFVLTGAIATLSSGLAFAQANPGADRLDPNDRVQSDRLPGAERLQTDPARPGALTTDHSTVTKVNKASGLIGMNVRNPQDERLGEIKDLVVDLKSGKVAYTVLSVGGFLGIGDKLIAVPPNAFTMAPDQDHLLLNADKARIENSPGFAKNAWPDLNSSEWATDSQYWLSDTAQGTIGTSRSGTALGTDADRIQSGTRTGTDSTTLTPLPTEPRRDSLDSDRQLDRDNRLNTGNDRLNATADRLSDRNVFEGKITAIDPEKRSMTVQGATGSRTFEFTDRPTITLKDNRNPRLVDLKVGYPVSVGFQQEDGKYVAHSVIRTDSPEVR